MTGFLDSLNRTFARLQATETIELDPETASHLSWRQVQNLVGDAFRRRGYGVRPGSTNAPVDFILDKDGERTMVNCKHWKVWEVGESPLREFYGYTTGIGAKRAVMVTTGRFSQRACDFADRHNLRLIDGRGLSDLVDGN
ncbi:MAG TPA: restriction endonuclease [Candidatus Dormibacteraeota bacterium]|nr:restriction endonuclease [Candidatus Dormibacteraeota bacterium]